MSDRNRDEWLKIETLAEELGVPVRTIYAWRTQGKGPRGARFGKHVRFRRSAVDAWAESCADPRSVA